MGHRFPAAQYHGSTIHRSIQLAQTVGEFTTHDFDGLERDEESLTWSANLQWDATDELMLYASASTGYKAGGFNSFSMGLARRRRCERR